MLRAYNKSLIILASALLLFVSFSASADKGWIKIVSAEDGSTWEAMPGSFEFSKNKSDVPIAVLAGRVISSKRKKIDLSKWYVTAGDCKNKMGK